MTPKARISLVVIQSGIAVVSLLALGVGLFGVRGTKAMEERQGPASEAFFDKKMRPFLGKTYTEEIHYKLMDQMRISDDITASSNEVMMAASKVMRDTGGIFALGSLASIFLIVKKPRPSKPSESPRPS